MNQEALQKSKFKAVQENITSKTQLALSAIKSYDVRMHKLNAYDLQGSQKVSNRVNQSIDADYTRIHLLKQLTLNSVIKIQIFPHNQEYYFINSQNLLFPVRIFMRNIKNTGLLFVGYDLAFPGLTCDQNQIRKNLIGQISDQNSDNTLQRRYTSKFLIQKDMMVPLLKDQNTIVKKIYLSFIANQQLLMFHLKFDYVGLPQIQIPDSQRIKKIQKKQDKSKIRFYTQLNEVKKLKYQKQSFLPPTHKVSRINSKFPRQGDLKYKQKLKTTYRQWQQNFQPVSQKSSDQSQKWETVKPRKQIPDTSAITRNQIRRQKSLKPIRNRQSHSNEQKVKANKQREQELKQKQLKVKNICSKFKKQIELYKKNYFQSQIKNKKFHSLVCPLIFATIFLRKSQSIKTKKTKNLASQFHVRHIVHKFIRKLKNKNQSNAQLVPSFEMRLGLSCFSLIKLQCQIFHGEDIYKAARVMSTTFDQLLTCFRINESFQYASKYRKSIKLIQKKWLLRYRARLTMLNFYGEEQALIMVNQNKRLKMAYKLFKTEKKCNEVCYQYMVDQSIKFRQIYDAFKKRLEEIQLFIQQNQKIRDYNKGKPYNKWKTYLQIPKKPYPPQQRFFRNLDILKSMLRAWLQIQSKKIIMKNIYGEK